MFGVYTGPHKLRLIHRSTITLTCDNFSSRSSASRYACSLSKSSSDGACSHVQYNMRGLHVTCKNYTAIFSIYKCTTWHYTGPPINPSTQVDYKYSVHGTRLPFQSPFLLLQLCCDGCQVFLQIPLMLFNQCHVATDLRKSEV